MKEHLFSGISSISLLPPRYLNALVSAVRLLALCAIAGFGVSQFSVKATEVEVTVGGNAYLFDDGLPNVAGQRYHTELNGQAVELAKVSTVNDYPWLVQTGNRVTMEISKPYTLVEDRSRPIVLLFDDIPDCLEIVRLHEGKVYEVECQVASVTGCMGGGCCLSVWRSYNFSPYIGNGPIEVMLRPKKLIKFDVLTVAGITSLSADGESKLTPSLSKAVAPIAWSIVGETLGCTIDSSTGVLTAGKEAGSVTIRGADAAGCYGDAKVDLKKCGDASCGGCSSGGDGFGGVSGAAGSVEAHIRLGWSQVGNDAGFLSIHEDYPSAQLATPLALHYKFSRPDVEVITNSWGLRQVFATEGLADVITNSASKYFINLYSATNVLAKTNGLYPTTGSPITVVTVESIGGDTNKLRVTRTFSGSDTMWDYQWITNSWVLTTGGGLRSETKNVVLSQTNTVRTVTGITRDGGGAALKQAVQTYQATPTGERLTKEVVGSGANAKTNTYTYYTNGYRQQTLLSDGSWDFYVYDEQNRPTNIFSSYLNQGVTTNASLCRLTEYNYSVTAVTGSGDDGSLGLASPRCTIEYLKGQEIARRYLVLLPYERREIQCVTPGATWDDTNNLVTITKTIQYGAHENEISSVQRPDGTMTIYTYGEALPNVTNVVWNLRPDSSGTMTTRVIGAQGQVVWQSTADVPSGIALSGEVYTYDHLKRLTNTTYLDGTSSSVTYNCCNMDSTLDREGTYTFYGYDALKRLVTTTRNGITISNALDAVGNTLMTVRYGTDGSAVTNQSSVFNDAGQLVSSKDALNNLTTYTNYLDGSGQTIRQTTLPDLSTRIETYAKDGSLLKAGGTAARGVRYDYGVEDDGGVQRAFTKTILLNTNGTDSAEWTKSYSDLAGRSYKTVLADGATNVTYFDVVGRAWKTVDPDGVTQLFQYNPATAELEFTAVDMDRDDLIDFDGTDRIVRTTNEVVAAHGTYVRRSQTYLWTTNGLDSAQLLSTSEQEVNGLRAWSTSYGLTNFSQTTYLGSGLRVSTQISPDGSQTLSTNLNGRLVSVTRRDALGSQLSAVSFGYDVHGRQATVTDARTGTSSVTYTVADQTATITTPVPASGQSAQTTTNFYDSLGRVWKTTLADGTSVTNEFFVTGELKKTYGSRTYPVEYTYDYAGRMKTMKTWQDFAGNAGTATTTWNYDSLRGVLTNKQYADGSGPVYTNTPSGRLLSRTWARGITTSYGYDNAGVMTGVDYSDATPDASYTYDRRGRLTQVSCLGTNSYTYNDAGLVVSEDYLVGSLNLGSQLRYGYDGLLRRTNLNNLSLQSSVGYGYDAASRLATVSEGTNSVTYSYVANSPLVGQMMFTNNGTLRLTTTKSYDLLNRLTNVVNANSQLPTPISSAYGYNTANQRTNQLREDGTYWVYQYDNLGQVTGGKKYWADGTPVAGQQFEYGFDDIGNRKSTKAAGDAAGSNLRTATYGANSLNQYTNRTIPGYIEVQGAASNAATVTVNGNAAYRKDDYYRTELNVNNSGAVVLQAITNQGTLTPDTVTLQRKGLVAATPETFLYDADGNLTNDGKWSYTWDAENRLLTMQSIAAIPDVAKRRLEYSYDCQGRRIYAKIMTWTGSAYRMADEERYWYDGWNLIGRANLASSRVQTFVWGLDLSGSMQGAGGVGGALWINDSLTISNQPSTHYYAYDGNGNVLGTISATDGTETSRNDYGPFGELLRSEGMMAKANPLRFSTKFQDEETGLLYYGFRYLDTSTGRWLSKDPIGENGGISLYGLLENTTIGRVDSLGLQFFGYSLTTQSYPGIGYSPGYNVPGAGQTVQADFSGVDWSELVKEFILDQSAVKASYAGGYSLPLGPAVINISFSGEFKVFKCLNDAGETRKMFEASANLEIKGGVGSGFGVKRYPEPKGRDRNKIDPKTNQKLKELAGKPLPWRQQGKNDGGYIGKENTSSADECNKCPAVGLGGSVAIFIYGEVGALITAEAKAKLEWDVLKPFTWQNIDGKIQGSLGIKAGASAQVGVGGEGKVNWIGEIE